MRHFMWIVFLALVLLAAWFGAKLYVPYGEFPREGVFVEIPKGNSLRGIARLLAQKRVVRSALPFEVFSRWRRRPLLAGEYFFDRPARGVDVFRKLAEGRVYVVAVVVPEGSNQFDIAALLERAGVARREAFLAAVRDPAPVLDLAPTARGLEGFLFPATYEFPRHVAPEEIAATMVRRFREAWQALPAEMRDHNAMSIEHVVTLASLVERETPQRDERPVVAGVFANRLRRGFPLQCDPTVIYALELAGRYNGRLDSRDLGFNSTYNTYRHAGLPPGPIANPGEASLRAALEPAAVDYFYFVANGQGGHSFSKTLAEHNRNVARYRRLLGQNGQAADDNQLPKAPQRNRRRK